MSEITREEQFLEAAAIQDASGLPVPLTREEQFLYAAATGETGNLPKPETRTEAYLLSIAESGGGVKGDDYQLLSYIQSNGTQAICLSNDVSSSVSIEAVFEIIENKNYKWIMGGEGQNSKFFGVQVNNDSVSDLIVHKNGTKIFKPLSNSRKNQLICCRIAGSDATVSWPSVNGTSDTISGSIDSTFEVLSGLYAFGVGRANQEALAAGMISARMHSVRVDDELYLPAKRVGDGTCGLLNMKTHQFLVDALDGDPFVAGDVIGTLTV